MLAQDCLQRTCDARSRIPVWPPIAARNAVCGSRAYSLAGSPLPKKKPRSRGVDGFHQGWGRPKPHPSDFADQSVQIGTSATCTHYSEGGLCSPARFSARFASSSCWLAMSIGRSFVRPSRGPPSHALVSSRGRQIRHGPLPLMIVGISAAIFRRDVFAFQRGGASTVLLRRRATCSPDLTSLRATLFAGCTPRRTSFHPACASPLTALRSGIWASRGGLGWRRGRRGSLCLSL